MKSALPVLALALCLASPAAAAVGHGFRNETTAGLRCRLSSEGKDTAMTIQLEPMETVTVQGPYRDIRCEEPVLRQRWPLADGGNYVFRRNKDGNTIGLAPR